MKRATIRRNASIAELVARVDAWTGELEALRAKSEYPPEWQFDPEDERRWDADENEHDQPCKRSEQVPGG